MSFWQKQQKSTGDWVQQGRSSSEHEALSPLVDGAGPDERRYYRSAEFQQALLEKKIEENLTIAAEDKRGRPSGKSRSRRGSVASKSSARHTIFDFDEEREKQAAFLELPPPAYNLGRSPSYVEKDLKDQVADSSVTSKKPFRNFSRPRIHFSGIGPLINFAGKKAESKKS